MTVGKASGNRRSVSTGCGTGSGKVTGDKKPAKPAVSTGCGASGGGGWKPKADTGGKKTSGLSERASSLLEKAKGKPAKPSKPAVSTGCGASPAKPKPAPRPAPTRTGC